MRAVSDILQNDVWRGLPCFIVGGGPSLKGFDWSILEGQPVIAINRALEFCNPSILLSMDSQVYRWFIEGDYGEQAKHKFEHMLGRKLWVHNAPLPYEEKDNELIRVPNLGKPRDRGDFVENVINWDFRKGIVAGGNSGYCAVQLALSLGADPIVLLGFDMKGDGVRQTHFHSGHPRGAQKEDVYKGFLNSFRILSKYFDNGYTKDTKPSILVVGQESALEYFPRVGMGMVPYLRNVNYKIRMITLATPNSGYMELAENLARSAKVFGYDCTIYAMDDIPRTWNAALRYRARFIRQVLSTLSENEVLLWVDSDCTFLKNPYYFTEFTEDTELDAAFTWCDWTQFPETAGSRKCWNELCAGVMLFRNRANVRALLDMWADWMEQEPNLKKLDQRYLQALLEEGAIEELGLKLGQIPLSHNQIFDSMASNGDPIIEHRPASRRLKEFGIAR